MQNSFIKYLQFYISATNRHGIHSPFIYELLDDVVYTKSPKKASLKKRNKEFQFYIRLFHYFKVQHIHISDNDSFFEQLFKEYEILNPDYSLNDNKDAFLKDNIPDVFILNNNHNHKPLEDFSSAFEIKNNAFVIIPQIRASKHQLAFWNNFIKNDFAIVCLEFFNFGLVFFRKENSREYFKIRF